MQVTDTAKAPYDRALVLRDGNGKAWQTRGHCLVTQLTKKWHLLQRFEVDPPCLPVKYLLDHHVRPMTIENQTLHQVTVVLQHLPHQREHVPAGSIHCSWSTKILLHGDRTHGHGQLVLEGWIPCKHLHNGSSFHDLADILLFIQG